MSFRVSPAFLFPAQVEPVMELAPGLMDRALSDDEDDAEMHCSHDVLVADKAYQVCSSALATGGLIPRSTDRKTVTYLCNRKAVDVLENGDVVLARDAIRYGTKVSGAVLERTCRAVPTTLEMAENMKSAGWRFVSAFQDASIQDKRATEHNPDTYYTLLTHFALSLLPYEEEGLFHHRQGEPYYKTVELAVSLHPDDLVDVPTYKPAKFYARLQAFLAGDCADDPRLEEEEHDRGRTL